MKVLKASVGDVEQIRDLIEFYAKKNLMLPRSLSYLYENLRDYLVVKKDGVVIGCCGLHITWGDLSEIKSCAVDPRYAGKGVGKTLLDAAKKEAKAMGIKKIFTLTLEPDFFRKNGFKDIPKDKLPMKIWGECINCPKYPECDEEALIYNIR
jgi:amino-acid N-acetyltransferase